MHHKFAILDHAVVLTGSFNWTVQAVKNNQENILFLENPAIANIYLEEFNRIWNEFKTVIDVDEAMEKVREERENKRKKKY
jgi:phosphatidylserine/phosphatidylglycerophosphate/cardiolipin synthase-like enzyme